MIALFTLYCGALYVHFVWFCYDAMCVDMYRIHCQVTLLYVNTDKS